MSLADAPSSLATTSSASPVVWPTIAESKEMQQQQKPSQSQSRSSSDWEFIPCSSADGQLPHSVSTPDFGHYECCSTETSSCEDDGVAVLERTISNDTSEDVVIVSAAPSAAAEDKLVKVKRVPSFKDAILLNAQESSREQAASLEKKLTFSSQATKARTKVKPKFVVQQIKRCSKSTGDLRSLSRIEDDEDDDILGACDAEEFYARKRHGNVSRQNGLKIRPDEAKRKEMIIHKKDMQRLRQQQRC